MGWKNVRDHYRVDRIVQIRPEGICIGAGYVPDLMVIGLDGTIIKRYERSRNDDLARCQMEMDADPAMLRHLVTSPDTFTTSITVYTFDEGQILELQCEQLGWPNVTHDGRLMHANRFSSDRAAVVALAKRDIGIGVATYAAAVTSTEDDLAKRRARLELAQARRAQLDAEYPSIAPAPR